jgi:hypothetical protein
VTGARLDAEGTILDPRTGSEIKTSRHRSGTMDPMATLHVGLVGAPALPVFVKRPKGFQMVAIVGTAVAVGTDDSNRAINLGRLAVGILAIDVGSGRCSLTASMSIPSQADIRLRVATSRRWYS